MNATESSGRQIRQQPLSELAHDMLLRDIINGRYQPGERLSIDALAEEFQISRTPVREALQRLLLMRFVEVTRNSRTCVARWSNDDMRQRLQLLGRISAFAALTPGVQNAPMLYSLRDISEGRDVQIYLELVESILSRQFDRLFGFLDRDVIQPLRIFLTEPALAAHGLTLEHACALRETHLAAALHALDVGDPQVVSRELKRYADLLSDALRHRAPVTHESLPAAV